MRRGEKSRWEEKRKAKGKGGRDDEEGIVRYIGKKKQMKNKKEKEIETKSESRKER